MTYFINEKMREDSNNTFYAEFFKGKWNLEDGWWNEGSVCINAYTMEVIGLTELLYQFVPDYDPFAEVEVTEPQWNHISQKAAETGGELFEAIKEVTPWVKDNFQRHQVFTILGL
ncbi:MAG: hypothetical protein IJF41_04960 [Clostridia bacterium]|nr:hypothetical protein [Clostridia bacterium]